MLQVAKIIFEDSLKLQQLGINWVVHFSISQYQALYLQQSHDICSPLYLPQPHDTQNTSCQSLALGLNPLVFDGKIIDDL